MSDFEPIETREQFEDEVSKRLERERESIEKRYEGFLSPDDVANKYKEYLSPDDEKKKYEGYLSPEEAAKKDAEIKRYETSAIKIKIAHEAGLPYELADRLSGENEKEMKKDAEMLKGLLGEKKKAPLRETEGNNKKNDAAYRSMLSEMKGE